jgi:hypothetical protein
MLITTLVVSFCKDGRGSVNVKLWFLVVYVRCEVLCRSVVLDNVFLFFSYHNDARSNTHQSLYVHFARRVTLIPQVRRSTHVRT